MHCKPIEVKPPIRLLSKKPAVQLDVAKDCKTVTISRWRVSRPWDKDAIQAYLLDFISNSEWGKARAYLDIDPDKSVCFSELTTPGVLKDFIDDLTLRAETAAFVSNNPRFSCLLNCCFSDTSFMKRFQPFSNKRLLRYKLFARQPLWKFSDFVEALGKDPLKLNAEVRSWLNQGVIAGALKENKPDTWRLVSANRLFACFSVYGLPPERLQKSQPPFVPTKRHIQALDFSGLSKSDQHSVIMRFSGRDQLLLLWGSIRKSCKPHDF